MNFVFTAKLSVNSCSDYILKFLDLDKLLKYNISNQAMQLLFFILKMMKLNLQNKMAQLVYKSLFFLIIIGASKVFFKNFEKKEEVNNKK